MRDMLPTINHPRLRVLAFAYAHRLSCTRSRKSPLAEYPTLLRAWPSYETGQQSIQQLAQSLACLF